MSYPRRNTSDSLQRTGTLLQRDSLGQQAFHRFISLERRRAERSKKSFLLMLVDAGQRPLDMSQNILTALAPMTRETDIIGWYKQGTVAGVVFTEIADDDLASTTTAIMNRVSKTLKNHLTAHQFSKVSLAFHLLPEDQGHKPSSSPSPSVSQVNIASQGLAVGLQ